MKIRRMLWLGLVIATPVFAWYLHQSPNGLAALWPEARNRTTVTVFLAATVLLIMAHYIRALKTKLFTDSIKVTAWSTHVRALFIGYLFNALLPLRIGEIIRAVVLGKSIKMSASFLFALVLLERAIDGLILGALGLVLVYCTTAFNAPAVHSLIVTTAVGLITISALVLIMLTLARIQPAWLLRLCYRLTGLFNNDVRDSLRFKIWSVMYGLERVLNRQRLVNYLGLALISWTLYLAAILPLTYTVLPHTTTPETVATSTVSYYGVVGPSGPSYVGSYQNYVEPYATHSTHPTAMHTLLSLTWLLQILPALLMGLVFVFYTKGSLKRPKASKSLQAINDKLLRNVDLSHNLGTFLEAFFTNNSLSRVMHRLEVDKDSKLIHYFKGGSNAVTALVYEDGQFLVRKITPIQYKYKLESQYKWLKDKAKLDRIVKVLGEETTDTYYKIDLEYRQEYMQFFDYIHSMPLSDSKKVLSEVFAYLFKHVYRPVKQAYLPRDLKAYIEDRCLAKIRVAAEVNDEIRSLLTYDTLIINGQEYKNIPLVLDQIKRDKEISQLLATYRKCSIHGDTTIDNMLASKADGSWLLIDPTDNENEISGPVFDFGRLSESLDYGYEFLNRDDRPVEIDENRINFEYSLSSNYAELAKHAHGLQQQYLTPEEQKSVLFHTGMLYSRMLTHRVVINPLNAAKYYAISVIAFNDFLEQARS